jgi:hypothetical protein
VSAVAGRIVRITSGAAAPVGVDVGVGEETGVCVAVGLAVGAGDRLGVGATDGEAVGAAVGDGFPEPPPLHAETAVAQKANARAQAARFIVDLRRSRCVDP